MWGKLHNKITNNISELNTLMKKEYKAFQNEKKLVKIYFSVS